MLRANGTQENGRSWETGHGRDFQSDVIAETSRWPVPPVRENISCQVAARPHSSGQVLTVDVSQTPRAGSLHCRFGSPLTGSHASSITRHRPSM